MAGVKYSWRRRRFRNAGVSVDVEIPLEPHGTGISTWVVASGRLDPDSVVYSVGVGRDLSLDLSLVSQYGCTVHCFDPTPVSAAWIRQQSLPSQIVFHEIGLAAHDGTMTFLHPRKSGSAHFTPIRRNDSGTDATLDAPVACLDTLMRQLGHHHLDLLKVDIEGGEYDVIEDIARHADRIDQLLMEFHHCYSTIPMSMTVDAVNRLRQAGFRVIHISPRTYEFSFVRM